MDLNVLLRGQSNAFYLSQSPDWPGVAAQIEQLLGFDGVTNTVTLLSSANDPFGKNTLNGGTAFIGDWLTPNNGNYTNGWTNTALESGFISYINALSPAIKSSPTAVVWLHNEYDSTNPNLTTAEWMSAVNDDATQVRQAFGQSAATTPYVFVNAIPYGSGSIDSVNQSIKLGMEEFSANLGFHALIGAQADDVSMDYQQTGIYGGPHIDANDGNLIDHRLAVSLAETFAQYALPGSPVATGKVDGFGPEVLTAQRVASNQVLVSVAYDNAVLNASLSGDAAAGVGWSLYDGSATMLKASAAQVVDSDHVLLTFNGTVPTSGPAAVYYAYGYGRLATSDSDPGVGTAIYDTQQMPVWTPATGVMVWQGAAAGEYAEINMDDGTGSSVQGFATSQPGYQSEFVALSQDSVAIVAETPNSILVAGNALDPLVATSGNNLLAAEQSSTLLVGGTGNDVFEANASGPSVWEVIQNFHAGDIFTLWGAASAQAPNLSWFDTPSGAAVAISGGGVSSALVLFENTSLQQAMAFAHTSGNAGGASYTEIFG